VHIRRYKRKVSDDHGLKEVLVIKTEAETHVNRISCVGRNSVHWR